MTWRTRTAIFCVLVLAVCIAWDILARVFGGEGATISWLVIDSAYRWPILSFAAGVLCGHLFWRAENKTGVT